MNHYALVQEYVLRQESLKELLSLVNRISAEAIVLRGDALAEFYYPDPVLRPAMDIDLLIHPQDLERLEQSLAEIGVLPVKEGGEIQLYYRESPPVMNIDIHTELWYVRDIASLWKRARDVYFLGLPAKILSPEDLFLHLVAHSLIHHGRFSHEDARDMTLVLEKEKKNFDWDLIQAQTQGSSFARFIYEALARLKEMTPDCVPEEILRRFQPRGIGRLLQKLISRLIQEKEQPYIAYFFKPLSISGFGRKWKFYEKILFPPEDFIRERFGLKHSWQVPLARFFRPFLLLVYAVRAVFVISLGKNQKT